MLFKALNEIYANHEILIDEPMSNHTSFKIGGKVKALVIPSDFKQIEKTIDLCHRLEQPFFIMGNGSNILVEDSGIDALIIKISDALSKVSIEDDLVIAEAGVLLSKLSKVVLRESLQGFEFASGIPGTLGGAIFMNAGAYGGEMKDVIEWVDVMTMCGEVLRVDRDHLQFGYRTSIVKDRNYIVLRVGIRLKKGDLQMIKEITNELTKKRVSKQPLELPSAGSTFKRPSGYFAGQLIEEAGLRGLRHGDAQVSEKHCGFIVNLGNATCKEVMELISVVQKVVFDTFDVELEREVRIFGKE
ncbi:UDP-N-acetylmuramate dehydrogenase [Fusibacter bizertensis]|uniref:UDP-N-acetylenolpyruvoylglucosamine reductase n=1 Tax=Fusibacter bizertensis TaxID=1488331 RepID=A0ABT6NB61_9FIRM|nr:UDP-N-acetylmuramate dehydrogenase [Fusibacter bizertensis]MDH8677658.1 UDP-N-acetylmuramate dehydrogenase [Fusibacter bizertensis]